jgi:hypothetical protein
MNTESPKKLSQRCPQKSPWKFLLSHLGFQQESHHIHCAISSDNRIRLIKCHKFFQKTRSYQPYFENDCLRLWISITKHWPVKSKIVITSSTRTCFLENKNRSSAPFSPVSKKPTISEQIVPLIPTKNSYSISPHCFLKKHAIMKYLFLFLFFVIFSKIVGFFETCEKNPTRMTLVFSLPNWKTILCGLR